MQRDKWQGWAELGFTPLPQVSPVTGGPDVGRGHPSRLVDPTGSVAHLPGWLTELQGPRARTAPGSEKRGSHHRACPRGEATLPTWSCTHDSDTSALTPVWNLLPGQQGPRCPASPPILGPPSLIPVQGPACPAQLQRAPAPFPVCRGAVAGTLCGLWQPRAGGRVHLLAQGSGPRRVRPPRTLPWRSLCTASLVLRVSPFAR